MKILADKIFLYVAHCVRNLGFWENLTSYVFLLPPSWDSPFCLITHEITFLLRHQINNSTGFSFLQPDHYLSHEENQLNWWRDRSDGKLLVRTLKEQNSFINNYWNQTFGGSEQYHLFTFLSRFHLWRCSLGFGRNSNYLLQVQFRFQQRDNNYQKLQTTWKGSIPVTIAIKRGLQVIIVVSSRMKWGKWIVIMWEIAWIAGSLVWVFNFIITLTYLFQHFVVVSCLEYTSIMKLGGQLVMNYLIIECTFPLNN